MSSRNLSRSIVACLLAAMLAGPAAAQARHAAPQHPVRAWEWLAGLWQRGITILVPWSQAWEKQGYGIDPTGGTTTGSPGVSSQGDAGLGIDPNGRPEG